MLLVRWWVVFEEIVEKGGERRIKIVLKGEGGCEKGFCVREGEGIVGWEAPGLWVWKGELWGEREKR